MKRLARTCALFKLLPKQMEDCVEHLWACGFKESTKSEISPEKSSLNTLYNGIVADESEQNEAKVKRVQEGEDYIQPVNVVECLYLNYNL
jgi:hypothetical protein